MQLLKETARILHALMLRDIKTRFGASEWGFLVAIGWPLSNILIVVAINSAAGRAVPYGESAALWVATGVIPFMAFQYMARFIMLGILLNRPMLAFPIVNVMDIVFARVIVEILNAGIVIIITALIFYALGIDAMPNDIPEAVFAILAMMLLGLGFGVVNAVLAGIFPFWLTVFGLTQILLWISSGILFVPDGLPTEVQTWLSYLPQLQGVEWMRSAYFEGYGRTILDKEYLLMFGAAVLFGGLMLERSIRGRIMQ